MFISTLQFNTYFYIIQVPYLIIYVRLGYILYVEGNITLQYLYLHIATGICLYACVQTLVIHYNLRICGSHLCLWYLDRNMNRSERVQVKRCSVRMICLTPEYTLKHGYRYIKEETDQRALFIVCLLYTSRCV